MKRLFLALIILISLSLVGKTYILVISSGEFRDERITPLPAALEDGTTFKNTIEGTIETPGEIVELVNPSYAEMLSETLKWARRGEEGDTLIFYYSGHGYSTEGKTYLIPKDVDTDLIQYTAYDLEEAVELIDRNTEANNIVMIIDACYAGSLLKDRPISGARIETREIKDIAEKGRFSFLFSSQPEEVSLERPEGGGYFTYYLVQGLLGEANIDGDEVITLEELTAYIREQVPKITVGRQNPFMFGKDITIAQDREKIYSSLIVELTMNRNLTSDYLTTYVKILRQAEEEDSPAEGEIRKALLEYARSKDLTTLIIKTVDAGTVQTTTQPQTQTKGNCLLKVIAGNELAKSGTVYLNDKEEGTLQDGQLTIFDLGIGIYTLAIDGEKIDKQEIEIKFESDYETREIRIEGKPATRVLRIVTIPPNAKIWIDGRELSSRSPWQESLEVGKAYEIEVYVEGYGRDKRIANVPTKGELIPFNITIPEARAPDKPQLTYPSNNARDIPAGNITLKWESKESNLTYRVEFDGKTYTTNNKSYTVSVSERGKTYSWKVVAVNEFGKETTSDEHSFRTMDNRAPNTPSNPSPSNNATNQPLTVTLSWDCSDPDGDAITYDVYFGTSSNPTAKASTNQSGKTLSKGNLSAGTTYYWKVVAKDSKGGTIEGPVWSFTTQSNRAPNAPSNLSPANNATNQPLTVTLSWDCSDPDGDTLTYEVYFGTNSNLTTKISTSQSGKTLSRSNLSIGTTYYWKVVAKDSKGATTEGPVWRFTTLTVPERMVLVEKGSFTMGDTWGDGYSNEKPTHKVTFTYDFYIGKYETTFDEYDAFCNATGKSKPKDEGWGRGKRPVINVNWWDAIAYCNWLSEKERLPKAYDSNGNLLDKDGRITTDITKVLGYRLPTEAEWEYVARGGNKSKGYKYSGSDNVGDVAWYSSNSGGKTQEVGTKAPNELGIYDMSGNVWEWCSDWRGNYSSSAQTNPYENSGSDRVFRGGSWFSNATYVRVASCANGTPTSTYNSLGFRICRTVPYEGGNRPPLAPYNPSPSDEAVIWPTAITLSWDSNDPDDDTMTYDVYLDTNVNPTKKVSSNQVENTLNRSNLSYGTTYYWKVVAKDSKGETTEGPIWSFSTHIDLTVYKPSTVVPLVILVEKGSFTMGDTWGGGESDEKPTHKVTFTYDFYIGKYEVTFDEYDAFCNATGRRWKPDDQGWGRGSRPVINVSWNGAIAYCNWLSEKEKLPKAYDSNGNLLDKDGRVTTDPSKVLGYRLPTEAEWEYAARGGNKSKGYKYSGSDNVGDVAWYIWNSGLKTQEVGKKAPNELGLYDMSGNVYEWCSDWYNSYASSAQTNPYNSKAKYGSGSGRVIRGGSWDNVASYARVASRFYKTPHSTYSYYGFRICRTVP